MLGCVHVRRRSGFRYSYSSHSIRKWFSDLCNTNWWCTKICSNNQPIFWGPFFFLSFLNYYYYYCCFSPVALDFTIQSKELKWKIREKNGKRVAVNKPPWNIWIIIKCFFFFVKFVTNHLICSDSLLLSIHFIWINWLFCNPFTWSRLQH